MSEVDVNLHREHKELVMALGDLKADISSVGGKVDTVVMLMQKQAERQDRADTRVDRLEVEMGRVRDESRSDVTALERKNAAELGKVNVRIALGVGAAGVLSLLFPVVVMAVLKLTGFG